MPFVSIIVPAYNAMKTLKTTIGDIIAQTYSNYELIIVDDGSIDGTSELCDNLTERDNRIRVIHQANAGPSTARNNGTKAATGMFVTYIDGDDRIEPFYLEALISALQTTGADIVCGRIDRIKAFDDIKPGVLAENKLQVFNTEEALSEMLTGHSMSVGPWCRLVPRELMLRYPFLDGKLYEDLSNTYKVNLEAKSVALVDQALYHYVMNGGTTTGRRKVSAKQCHDYYEAINLCLEGVLAVYPDLEQDAAVCAARDYMSLYLHIHRCDENLQKMEQSVLTWMHKNWSTAFGNKKAPRSVRLRILLFGISPWLYEKFYYIGIKFTGKAIA